MAASKNTTPESKATFSTSLLGVTARMKGLTRSPGPDAPLPSRGALLRSLSGRTQSHD